MIGTQHHIIESARIEVTSPTGNHALQRAVANWWSATALPAIEGVLEDVLPEGTHLRLEQLVLDLGHFKQLDPDLPHDRDELVKRLRQTLRSTLGERLAKTRVENYLKATDAGNPNRKSAQEDGKKVISTKQRRFTAWLYFLEHGHRPWWSAAFPPANEWSAIIEQSLSEPEQRAAVAKLLQRSRAAAMRLAADVRHMAAFKSLLEGNKQLKAAWAIWRTAAPAYADLATRLPSSAPPATEWTTAGRVAWWWFALTNTNFTSEIVALKAMLRVVVSSLEQWPEEHARGLLQLLKLPVVDSGVISSANHPTHDIRDPDVEGETTATALTEEGQAEALPLAVPEEEADSTTQTKKQVADPQDSTRPDNNQASELSTHTPLTDNVSVPDGAPIEEGKWDTPETVAWTKTGPSTPTAPAAAPPNTAEVWYVEHAGVVLVHPFLAPLFSALGYWLDGAFVDATAHQRAVYLTHYLATGAPEAYEEDLPLCKLLCGWPVSGAPAQLTVPLTATDRHEADEVLRSVIEHWQAIGGASVEGLREGFFAREGRLRKVENGWQVTVNRQAQDILLGRLPWGISLVQAPWHDSFIKVVW